MGGTGLNLGLLLDILGPLGLHFPSCRIGQARSPFMVPWFTSQLYRPPTPILGIPCLSFGAGMGWVLPYIP